MGLEVVAGAPWVSMTAFVVIALKRSAILSILTLRPQRHVAVQSNLARYTKAMCCSLRPAKQEFSMADQFRPFGWAALGGVPARAFPKMMRSVGANGSPTSASDAA